MECVVPEFGGKALGEGVWVGFRPSTMEGVSECRGGALGGGCRGGAWALHGRREAPSAEDWPGNPTGSLVPKWTGKALAAFPSVPPCPLPWSPPGSPLSLLDP